MRGGSWGSARSGRPRRRRCTGWISGRRPCTGWTRAPVPRGRGRCPAGSARSGWGGRGGAGEAGRAVVALEDGLHLLDLATGELQFVAGPDRVPGTRFNDGKASPDGRFFAGTMDEEQLSRPLALLFRLDPDLSLHRVVEDLIVSNGLAWTADGRT